MIDVKLIAHTNVDPMKLASHAALMCYQAESPEPGKLIDVENRLFKVGHHTTLQHWSATFQIEGIAVGDITFGMHLASPFYNSCQRSGRYSAKMFIDPDFKKIKKYIETFWSDNVHSLIYVMRYIRRAVSLYHENVSKAKEIAVDFLKNERPFISDKSLEQNAPKIAQEQMRMFIPVIFPTAFDFTVNLTVLVAMWETAWTPATKFVTNQMAEIIMEKFPETKFMFNAKRRRSDEWAIWTPKVGSLRIKYKPSLKLLGIDGEKSFISPNPEFCHPIDKLHFMAEMMDDSTGGVKTAIEISAATMGQDQRHRTIRRGKPRFTGNFYVPPIMKKMGLEKKAISLMKEWISLRRCVPRTLAMLLAPYGAMVTYTKNGSFNAVAHEQGKRLCWCAQEEVYHLSRLLRLAIEKKKSKKSKLSEIFEPPCYRTGKCVEGVRYCGRDIKLRKKGNYFPERKV